MPDLALAIAAFAVIWLFVAFGGPGALLRDSDTGWHIRAGERIFSTRSLPRIDPFSFSKQGQPWIAWEWGADVMIGGVHRLAGLGGVVFVYTLAIGASVWMWVRLHWAVGGNFLLTCFAAAPMLSTVSLHWLARPHIFGWLFLIATVWICERLPGNIDGMILLLAGAGGALWANLHGSFFLGPVVALVYAAGAWGGSILWDRHSTRSRHYLLLALAATAGSFFNPMGWHLHAHVLAYLTDSDLLAHIAEFQSFNFRAAGSIQIVLALLIGIGGGFAALSCRRPDRFILALVFTIAALRSARMLQVAALLLLPLANGSITSVLVNARFRKSPRKALDTALDYGLGLRGIDRTVRGYALLPVAAILLWLAIASARVTFPSDRFPSGSIKTIAALPVSARIFTSDSYGGYLIYRFAGERKVFFDGRSDFYGSAFLAQYTRTIQLRPGWREEFARWHFTHALLPVDSALAAALQTDGWRRLQSDPTAILLEKPGT